jgi:LmbE family N-acetylglucosaminyl deacetylase
MSTVLVVAPHPDDETIGCGGTLLRHVAAGDEVHWLIVTAFTEADGIPLPAIVARRDEIVLAGRAYGFRRTHALDLPETRIDAMPLVELVRQIGEVVRCVAPEILYLPYRGDAHSDHRVVFDAAAACTKWFRFPSVRQVLAYETLSETDFGLNPDRNGFRPNVFYDISAQLEKKMAIMDLYASEMAPPPFPRSASAIRSLAIVRGASCGCAAAEAFMLLREIR